VNFEDTIEEIISLANKFISEWKNIEIYPESEKLKKQFGYADKKWIGNVVILGEWEKKEGVYKVKNMKNWIEEIVKL
jgi:histidyl-tRNA synthetase